MCALQWRVYVQRGLLRARLIWRGFYESPDIQMSTVSRNNQGPEIPESSCEQRQWHQSLFVRVSARTTQGSKKDTGDSEFERVGGQEKRLVGAQQVKEATPDR